MTRLDKALFAFASYNAGAGRIAQLRSENHLRWLLQAWVPHYNVGRPHMSLGPGIPQPPSDLPVAVHVHRHQLPPHLKVVAQPILGGLHHEYGLAEKAV